MRRSLGALLLILLTSACDDNGIRRERPDETFAGPDDIGAMADIPAGAFPMGCNGEKDGACDGDEFPYHIVSLSAYRIGKYEVTADEYAACVAAGAEYEDQEVVIDGNMVSSRSPDDLPAFDREMIKLIRSAAAGKSRAA